jgi:hypothetical protein
MAKRKVTRERWKAIPGFRGYEASTRGRIRSVPRSNWHFAKWRNDGTRKRILFKYKGKILTPHPARGGWQVTLSTGKAGRQFMRTVHLLVMLTFVGPRPGKPYEIDICHGDGNTKNNRLSNLRYDTKRGNHDDRWKHGTMNIGAFNGTCKLTPRQVRAIRKRTDGLKAICRDYHISESTAWGIRTGKHWKWLK